MTSQTPDLTRDQDEPSRDQGAPACGRVRPTANPLVRPHVVR